MPSKFQDYVIIPNFICTMKQKLSPQQPTESHKPKNKILTSNTFTLVRLNVLLTSSSHDHREQGHDTVDNV